jgi:hypothetical protein
MHTLLGRQNGASNHEFLQVFKIVVSVSHNTPRPREAIYSVRGARLSVVERKMETLVSETKTGECKGEPSGFFRPEMPTYLEEWHYLRRGREITRR